MIEVYISTYQLERASDHIEILERRAFGGPLNNGSTRGDRDRDRDGDTVSGSGNESEKHKAYLFQVSVANIHASIYLLE